MRTPPGLYSDEFLAAKATDDTRKNEDQLTRNERLWLAQTIYGLYMFGMANTVMERTDEDCAMDNMLVPFYRNQLTDTHKKELATRLALLTTVRRPFVDATPFSSTLDDLLGL